MRFLVILPLLSFIPITGADNLKAAAETQGNDYQNCIQLYGAGLTQNGAYVFAKNVCHMCVKFSPRVHGPNGAIEPVSTTVTLGQPIWDIALQPGEAIHLAYAAPPGQWTPVMENPRAC